MRAAHALRNFLASSFVLVVAIAACGGGGDSGPVPLKHHFDDMHIAAVPLGEKNQVIQAQNDYSVAKMERAKAESDFSEMGTKLEVAKNELQQALLAEKSAKSKKKAADESSDMTRVNAAAAEMRSAELSRKAADEKVGWVKAQREYLKKFLRYTEENMYAQEAKYELAKARLAQSKNIRPKGFDFGAFESQFKKRSERAQRAKAVSQSEKQKADSKKKQWQQMESAANRAAGTGQPEGGGTGAADGG